MNPYHLNYLPGSQATEDDFVLPVPSVDQDFRVHPAFPASVLEYHSTTVQPSYSFPGLDGHGTSHAPRTSGTNPTRSLRAVSAGGGSLRTSTLSSHPYHQARQCRIADRAPARQQGWDRPPPFPTFSAIASAPDAAIPCHAVINGHPPDHCYDSSQFPPVAQKSPAAPAFVPESQPIIVAPDTNENIASSTTGLAVPGQVLLPTLPPSPGTLADEADIEYAQYRYGDKRCFYRCRFDVLGSPCNKWIIGDRTRVLRHLRSHHHLQTGPAVPAVCRWDECTHSRPMKQENLSRHVVMHLGVKWRCPHCRRLFSRDDAVHRHIERMVPGMDATDAEVVPGREARAITEPQSRRARTA